MTKKQEIQLFEEKKVRTVWDDELEKWFFCVVDVVEVLAESKDPKSYIKKMKQRDPELSKGWGQIVTPLSVQTAGGPQRMNCAEREGVFRIIQAILHLLSNPSRVMGIAKRDGIGRYAVSLRAICRFSDSNKPFLFKGHNKRSQTSHPDCFKNASLTPIFRIQAGHFVPKRPPTDK